MSQRTREKSSLGTVYAGWFLIDVDLILITPLLVPVAAHFGAGLGTVTLALTAYLLLFGVMQPVYGILSDAIGRVRVMRIGLAGLFAGNLLAALAPNVGTLIAGRAVAGAFAAALVPVTVAYVGDRVPMERRRRAMAVLMSISALGVGAGTVSAGVLTDLLSWRAAILLVSVSAAVLAVLYGRLPETLTPRAGRPMALDRVRSVFDGGWFRFLTVFALVEGAAMVGFYNFFSAALQADGNSVWLTGVVTGSYGLGAVGGGVLMRFLDARVPAAALFGGGCALLFAGYLVPALSQSVPGLLAASLLSGAALAVAQSTLQAWVIEAAAPEVRGTAASLVASAVFTGAAIATAAVGGLAAAGEFGLLFGIAAAVTLPVLVVGVFARVRFDRARRPSPSPPDEPGPPAPSELEPSNQSA
ncbi:MFS transporter [Sphaerisporangium sp. TRM90804]|uniref:MFS transporter n=1 Tax=Sphaerisporangium sp. TRM90804 TaxID=3031113 RepID=UPI00244D3FEF|nr:MFS transporter [Sphaerisporangium sp. TRM90804]MDH2428023.1 MFS transporter [Sphaerisporangium sp. TRM90804]